MLSDSPTQEHPRAEQCAFLWGCGAGGSAWQAGEPRASLCCREGSSAVGLQCHQGRALVGHVQLQLLGLQTALHPLLEGGGGDGVEDGIQGAVDGQDEDDHPRGDGACANKDTTLSSLRGGCPLPRGNPPAPAHATKRGDALHRLKWGACNYCSLGRGKGPGKPVPLSISSCSPCVGEESSKLSRTYIEGPPTQGLTAGSSQRWALLRPCGELGFTWYFHLQQGEQLEEEDGYPAESISEDDEEEPLCNGDFPRGDASLCCFRRSDVDGIKHARVGKDDGDEGCKVQAWRGRNLALSMAKCKALELGSAWPAAAGLLLFSSLEGAERAAPG